jgi:FixJ family two-component response regulator
MCNVSQAAPTVHLVDDDASFLRAASRLLKASGFTVAAFGSAAELLAHLCAGSRGCVVADLHMPGVSGLELQEELLKLDLALPVIFLTGQGDIPSSVRAMRLGAEDFLEKRAPKAQLVDAVTRALAREAAEHARRCRRQALVSAFDRLTPREKEVLEYVLRGGHNKQIALALNIHERTVKLHRTAITTKLGVSSVAEITRLAQEAGFFDAGATTFP